MCSIHMDRFCCWIFRKIQSYSWFFHILLIRYKSYVFLNHNQYLVSDLCLSVSQWERGSGHCSIRISPHHPCRYQKIWPPPQRFTRNQSCQREVQLVFPEGNPLLEGMYRAGTCTVCLTSYIIFIYINLL